MWLASSVVVNKLTVPIIRKIFLSESLEIAPIRNEEINEINHDRRQWKASHSIFMFYSHIWINCWNDFKKKVSFPSLFLSFTT